MGAACCEEGEETERDREWYPGQFDISLPSSPPMSKVARDSPDPLILGGAFGPFAEELIDTHHAAHKVTQ